MAAWDLVAVGRLSLDLYALEETPKPATRAFGAFIGGNPLNVAVGASRLGLRAALVSAVGEDPVGEFILARLAAEGVDIAYVFTKPGFLTPAVVLFREPGGVYPLTFYRERAPDAALTLAELDGVPIEATRVLFVSGSALAREPTRSAVFALAERARRAGVAVYLDLDFRPTLWHDPRAYGVVVRSFLPWVHVAIGGVKEIKALRPGAVRVVAHQGTEPEVEGDLEGAIREALGAGLEALVIKGGEKGSGVRFPDGTGLWVEAFTVPVVTPLGAGDAFAAGLVWARLSGLGWREALTVANAAGALVASRLACADAAPRREELLDFLRERGVYVGA
ncbi:PfkB family carbohydrate kinase [Thermus scotoductus]|uniref:Carbohydrate kinase n=1 Tax=Thermus scotoductus TaxID=37636 RepID=A0A430RQA9_THESC|nr:PfkB family carbohydrate kinase [Thermus scotoductus]RTH21301.1 carbohydrate kinase [Thermus scotoductus]RTI33977.1 carbohydrate kinase [Thermus scotoductus]